MSAKILVADDSATIQKVVKITLADEPFEVIEAANEAELFTVLRSESVDLVLLDFNLSAEKTGYQLAEEITKKYANTSVMAMLGTFDSVDDAQLKKNGAQDKIIKPFDSQKFVQKCHALVEITEEADIAVEIQEEEQDEASDWTVDQPEVEEVPVEQLLESDNQLEEVAQEWLGDVPGIIEEEEPQLDTLEIEEESIDVEEEPQLDTLEMEEESDKEGLDLDSTSTFRLEDIDEGLGQKTPADEDLEYPETIAMYKPSDNAEPTSQLVSLDELAPEEDDDDDDSDDVTDPAISLEPNLELEKEIEKEVSPDDFWAVDEEAEVEEQTVATADGVNYGKLADELKERLAPFIENIVKDICTQNIEKITWEVIPDLAENLIKKELKEISDNLE